MKIKINKENLVIGPTVPSNSEIKEIEISEEEATKLTTIKMHHAGKVIDDKLVDIELLDENTLRDRRNQECFSYIDRSQLGYNSLTNEQKAEIQTGYNAGLKVTETKVIPEKPEGLN